VRREREQLKRRSSQGGALRDLAAASSFPARLLSRWSGTSFAGGKGGGDARTQTNAVAGVRADPKRISPVTNLSPPPPLLFRRKKRAPLDRARALT